MKGLIKFHHYGLAVQRFDEAILFHKNLGYTISNEVHDKIQKVNIVICNSELFPSVELVKPASNSSPINNYLKKNNEIDIVAIVTPVSTHYPLAKKAL